MQSKQSFMTVGTLRENPKPLQRKWNNLWWVVGGVSFCSSEVVLQIRSKRGRERERERERERGSNSNPNHNNKNNNFLGKVYFRYFSSRCYMGFCGRQDNKSNPKPTSQAKQSKVKAIDIRKGLFHLWIFIFPLQQNPLPLFYSSLFSSKLCL
jgi:hypothetical protein